VEITVRQRLTSWADWGALVGAVMLLGSLGAFLVVGRATVWIEVAGALGVVLVILPVLLNPARARAALLGRQARYGGNAVVATVALVAIVGLLNYRTPATPCGGTSPPKGSSPCPSRPTRSSLLSPSRCT
jgi:hypothetical protein